MTQPTNIVSTFASSLDAEDYQTTLSCLDERCTYASPTGKLTGPTAIIESYKGNGDDAQKKFDAIKYQHEVTALQDNTYMIAFSDELFYGDQTHISRCNQRIYVDNGKITNIIHEEIPEQRDALNTFIKTLNIKDSHP